MVEWVRPGLFSGEAPARTLSFTQFGGCGGGGNGFPKPGSGGLCRKGQPKLPGHTQLPVASVPVRRWGKLMDPPTSTLTLPHPPHQPRDEVRQVGEERQREAEEARREGWKKGRVHRVQARVV